MKKQVFEYRSYKRYLSDWIRSAPKRGRGAKAALASAAHCQSAYVSHVLNGDRDFSLEQAEGINSHLNHSEDESQFFILLVLYARAGTVQLRKRLETKMQFYVDRHQTLKDRFQVKETFSPEVQATYYSSWHYSAAHILLTIPHFRTKDAIAQALGLNMKTATPVLEFLVSIGLATKNGNQYVPGENRSFVGKDSPFVKHHHANWRHRAIEAIGVNEPDNLHYSSAVSISKEDAQKIRFLLLKAIEDMRSVCIPSKEEELHSFCLDFFKLA